MTLGVTPAGLQELPCLKNAKKRDKHAVQETAWAGPAEEVEPEGTSTCMHMYVACASVNVACASVYVACACVYVACACVYVACTCVYVRCMCMYVACACVCMPMTWIYKYWPALKQCKRGCLDGFIATEWFN